jgi:hypothetical protein
MRRTVSVSGTQIDREDAMFAQVKIGSLAWWIWAILAGLMLLGLAGWIAARDAAMVLAILQVVSYLLVYRSPKPFPTQLRLAYVLWMAVSLVPPLFIMYWILAAGTTARVATGYCAMARLLLLLPWNRSVPLTWARIRTIALHPPIQGSVINGLPL